MWQLTIIEARPTIIATIDTRKKVTIRWTKNIKLSKTEYITTMIYNIQGQLEGCDTHGLLRDILTEY